MNDSSAEPCLKLANRLSASTKLIMPFSMASKLPHDPSSRLIEFGVGGYVGCTLWRAGAVSESAPWTTGT